MRQWDTNFVMLDNKFCFTCNELDLHLKNFIVQKIKIRILVRLEAYSKNLHSLFKIKQDKMIS